MSTNIEPTVWAPGFEPGPVLRHLSPSRFTRQCELDIRAYLAENQENDGSAEKRASAITRRVRR